MLLSYAQLGVNALHIVIALNYFTLVCNLITVLVDLVIFAMVKVDNFCKNKLIDVQFEDFDEKDVRIDFSKSEGEKNLSIWMFNGIIIVMIREIVF